MIQINKPMPNCCNECFAFDDNGDYPFCLITRHSCGYKFNIRANRMPDCPLIARLKARPVWIDSLNPEAKMCTWKCSSLCSVCGDHVATSWKYCPNCGAKMINEE